MLLFQIIVPCVIQNLWRPGRVERLRSRKQTKKRKLRQIDIYTLRHKPRDCFDHL